MCDVSLGRACVACFASDPSFLETSVVYGEEAEKGHAGHAAVHATERTFAGSEVVPCQRCG